LGGWCRVVGVLFRGEQTRVNAKMTHKNDKKTKSKALPLKKAKLQTTQTPKRTSLETVVKSEKKVTQSDKRRTSARDHEREAGKIHTAGRHYTGKWGAPAREGEKHGYDKS